MGSEKRRVYVGEGERLAADVVLSRGGEKGCGYLNVLEEQNRRKFKGMEISGVVANVSIPLLG